MAGIPQPSIGNLPWVECECGSKMYKSRMMFKKCSAILSPSGKEENIPVEVVICAECGRIPDFIAKNIGIENDPDGSDFSLSKANHHIWK